MVFVTHFKVHFDEADPAGIAFSAGLFTKIHRCYEEFIQALQQDPKQFFLSKEQAVPIREMRGEFLGPLFPMQEYQVDIHVENIGNSSFQLQYQVKDGQDTKALFHSSHVYCTTNPLKKSPLPDDLKASLKRFVVAG